MTETASIKENEKNRKECGANISSSAKKETPETSDNGSSDVPVRDSKKDCPLQEEESKNSNCVVEISSDSDSEIICSTSRKRRRNRRNRSRRNKRRRVESETIIVNDYSKLDSLPQSTSSEKQSEECGGCLNNNLEQFGQNFYAPNLKPRKGLRPIFIDGSNVAYGHGKNEEFSVKGLKICIDFFKNRGHEVKAFVPQFRLQKNQCTDTVLLKKLVDQKVVIITPTLMINNQRRIPYDDWYVVQSAAIEGGIIVSRDSYQDIARWQPSLRPIVEKFRLVPTWVDDIIIFPMDPLGNRQNNLETFLKF